MMGSADPASVDDTRSVALPFAAKPANLNGELVGDAGFDPFKFSDKGDVAKYREAELKHGRVAMLAVVGILTQEIYQWNEAFPSKNFLEALKTAPTLGLIQVLLRTWLPCLSLAWLSLVPSCRAIVRRAPPCRLELWLTPCALVLWCCGADLRGDRRVRGGVEQV
jgi:hypothetical protein